MKKLLTILSIMILASILVVPNHTVSAQVIVTEVEIAGGPTTPYPDCEKIWTSDGVTHLRECVVPTYYTSEDFRLEGPGQIIMYRNVFDEIGYPAVGHGSWFLNPTDVEGGYWAGIFTASIDADGFMSVYISGKGYGTLKGLLYETTTHSMGGTGIAYITTLPSYDGPLP